LLNVHVLQDEEETLRRPRRIPNTYTGEDRTKKQEFVPSDFLIELFRTVAKHHKLKGITQDVLNLAGLAVQERLRGLIERANAASIHAWDTGAGGQLHTMANSEAGDGPGENVSMYTDGKTPVFDRNLRKDVGMQLLAIEKIEKAEEMRIRKERKERVEQARQSGGGNVSGFNPIEKPRSDCTSLPFDTNHFRRAKRMANYNPLP
jgi:Transcription initiation factor TFIID component TAF4 family